MDFLQSWSKVRLRRYFAVCSFFLLIFCVIARAKKHEQNQATQTVFFTIYGAFKMLVCHFSKFDFFNFIMTFAKSLMKNSHFLWQIFKVLINFYYLKKKCHVEIFDSIMMALWIIFAFYTKVHFLCLLLPLRRFADIDILKWVILSFALC